MKIVVAARCFNEEKNISRFMTGYSFADEIVISDGGSTDDSLKILSRYPKATVVHFKNQINMSGQLWNPENQHINSLLKTAKSMSPDWIILDDMDDVPNYALRQSARKILEENKNDEIQFSAFRLYMWGDDQYFPYMNRNFDPLFKSLWAWQPSKADIRANESKFDASIIGIPPSKHGIDVPMCLLHKSWHPDTIAEKIKRYKDVGIEMQHPMDFAGKPEPLPEWARE